MPGNYNIGKWSTKPQKKKKKHCELIDVKVQSLTLDTVVTKNGVYKSLLITYKLFIFTFFFKNQNSIYEHAETFLYIYF